jgi:hypothetical protein
MILKIFDIIKVSKDLPNSNKPTPYLFIALKSIGVLNANPIATLYVVAYGPQFP